MVEGREKLGNVKDKSAGRQILDLTYMNEMGKCNTHISCGFELETAKLTVVNRIISNHMKLDSVTDNFFNEFSQCI